MKYLTLSAQVRDHNDALTRLRADYETGKTERSNFEILCASHVNALEKLIGAINGVLADGQLTPQERYDLEVALHLAKDAVSRVKGRSR